MTEKFKRFLPEVISATKEITVDEVQKIFDEGKYSKARLPILASCLKQICGKPSSVSAQDQHTYLKMLSAEMPTWIMLSLMAPYFKRDVKEVHVVQKDFFSKFKNVNMDMLQYKHIPKELCTFVKLPECISDGQHQIDEFFAFCGHYTELVNLGFKINTEFKRYETEGYVVGFAFLDKTGETANFVWRFRPTDDSMTVVSTFENNRFLTLKANEEGKAELKETISPNGYTDHVPVMFNFLAYLKSGDPDLREYKNPVRYKSPESRKTVRADREFSTKDIILVGYSFKKEPLRLAEEWEVMPHLRWQRCGEEYRDVKLVMVKGHKKKWRETGGGRGLGAVHTEVSP